VILTAEQLAPFRGAVAMVDGGFDPLHPGHIAYFRAAARLGLPVLANVSPDSWIARKHRPLLPQADRVAIIDALRDIALVHPSQGTTEDVLRALAPRYYVKGADWRGKLPPEQEAICADNGTEIVFLDTVLASSTAILERYRA
jgi:cytidyltransferase-like protein